MPPADSSASRADELLRLALAQHQSGDLPTAEALYRQLLELVPRHFDATHLLGVVALQTGRLGEAERLIGEALSVSPDASAAHNNLGTVFLRQNRLEEALVCLSRAVELHPDFASAHLNLGNVLLRQGKIRQGVEHLRHAAALEPSSPAVQSSLGAALLQLGESAEAIRAFEQAVKLAPAQPVSYANLAAALTEAGEAGRALAVLDQAERLGLDSSDLLTNRGIALAMLGRYPEAQETLERAVESNPASAAAYRNLGRLLRDCGETEQAIAPLERAVELDPQSVPARVELIQALHEAGSMDEAEECLRRLLADHPGSPAALAQKGTLCFLRDDRIGAEHAWREALAVEPGNADVRYRLGNLLMLGGRGDEAVAEYRKALATDPDHVQARWAAAMAEIPAIPEDEKAVHVSRQNFHAALLELEDYFDARRTVEGYQAVGSTQPYYLAYQAQDNRELMARYGALCGRLMASWQERNTAFHAPRPEQGPIRVGFVSAHVSDHSVWNAIVKGWVKNLDRRRFEIVLFSLGERCDGETELAMQWAAGFESGHSSLPLWVRSIAEFAPHVLIYPEIGMHAMTTKLASLRLAPIQAAAWGHPETTGLPTMDYYLTAAAFEPEGSQAYYTERLVPLPGLGVCYEPMPVDAMPPDLPALGLPGDQPLLICPGQPFKYAPHHDRLWVEISRRARPARLVFFGSKGSDLSRQLADRLRKRYRMAGLDFERCVSFIPALNRPGFHGLMKHAHVCLDTPGFSGFNTVMQAVECSLPLLAHEGRFLRGRFGSGILRRMGLDELVAATDEDYVDLAATLVADATWRAKLRSEIENRRERLFGDTAPVRLLEEFLIETTGALNSASARGRVG